MTVPARALRSVWFAVLLLAACGDKVTVNAIGKGVLGESCRARNDCAEGLFCRDLVCTEQVGTSDAGAAGIARGGEGESCQRRDDCEAPLTCVANVCLKASSDAGTAMVISSLGRRGEDCDSSRDCAQGLVCVGSVCRDSDFGLDYAPKLCELVECSASADCCKAWEASRFVSKDECDGYKLTCENSGLDCGYYSSYCVCPWQCAEEQCQQIPGQHCLAATQCNMFTYPGGCVNNRCAECTIDLNCSANNPLEPYCVANKCVECKDNTHCNAPETCVQGLCQLSGCTLNEHCGQFEACQDNECVEVGCQTDRECFFATGNERARCVDKECTEPCETDAECSTEFTICHEGTCRFVGCTNDEECRVLDGIQNQSSNDQTRAVCREPSK